MYRGFQYTKNYLGRIETSYTNEKTPSRTHE